MSINFVYFLIIFLVHLILTRVINSATCDKVSQVVIENLIRFKILLCAIFSYFLKMFL